MFLPQMTGGTMNAVKEKTGTKPKTDKRPKQPQGANQRLGRIGEDLSCTYLQEKEFKIIERNWTCKAGEADIIALDHDTLVFIEVKTRSTQYCGLPEDAVTQKKRTKYENIAIRYLATHHLPSSRVRFDVISLMVMDGQRAFLRHHRDAYCTD
jgi:putative endonuclease